METEGSVVIGMAGSYHQRNMRLMMAGLLWGVRKREGQRVGR